MNQLDNLEYGFLVNLIKEKIQILLKSQTESSDFEIQQYENILKKLENQMTGD